MLWGGNGRVVVPLSGAQLSQVRTLPLAGGESVVAWAENLGVDDEPIHVGRFDTTGTEVWTAGIVDLKSRARSTSRLAAARTAVGTSVYVWTDGDSARDLYGQNLNDDGHVGVERLVDGFESGDTSNWSSRRSLRRGFSSLRRSPPAAARRSRRRRRSRCRPPRAPGAGANGE